MSMTYCAEKFTWFRKPKPDELPHIGTTQDIAWAVWNRAGAADIKDIKYLIVTQIVNPGSRDIYIKALNSLDPPQSEWKLWPGQDFGMDTVGGQAILGMFSNSTQYSLAALILTRLTRRALGRLLHPTAQGEARQQPIHRQSQALETRRPISPLSPLLRKPDTSCFRFGCRSGTSRTTPRCGADCGTKSAGHELFSNCEEEY
jgi:hypothetical protein